MLTLYLKQVISCHTADPDHGKPKLVAVAALLQKQTSAIVTLKSSGIDRARLLDGRKYASYQGRFGSTCNSNPFTYISIRAATAASQGSGPWLFLSAYWYLEGDRALTDISPA
jgi:hypothetical protein